MQSCSTCGNALDGDTCATCDAAFEPEQDVRLPASMAATSPTSPTADGEAPPSIEKEYHYSFTRIQFLVVLVWVVILAIGAIWAGAQALVRAALDAI